MRESSSQVDSGERTRGPARHHGGAQWSRDGAGGMSCGGDAGQLENNHDEEQAASSSSAAQQNVFREVFDERSEPSDTGEGLKRHAVRGRAGKIPESSAPHTITHIDPILTHSKL